MRRGPFHVSFELDAAIETKGDGLYRTYIRLMAAVEKSVMDVFIEGIRARTRGDAISANPHPVAARDHGVRLESWRIYDTLQEDPPTDAELLDRLARGDLH
jgi:hypothetical protein